MRPVYGVWLAEIEHSNLQDEPQKEIVLNAWFLKDGNFEKRQVDEYVRFIVVQGDKPWRIGKWSQLGGKSVAQACDVSVEGGRGDSDRLDLVALVRILGVV